MCCPVALQAEVNAGGRGGSANTTKLLDDMLQVTAGISQILLVYLVNTSMGAFDADVMDVIKVQHVLVDGHVHSLMQAPFRFEQDAGVCTCCGIGISLSQHATFGATFGMYWYKHYPGIH